MNCIKTKDGWKATQWNQDTSELDYPTLSSEDISKLDAKYDEIISGIENYNPDSAEILTFSFHTADLSGSQVTYNSGLYNYRTGEEHNSYKF